MAPITLAVDVKSSSGFSSGNLYQFFLVFFLIERWCNFRRHYLECVVRN